MYETVLQFIYVLSFGVINTILQIQVTVELDSVLDMLFSKHSYKKKNIFF